jgi:hypothetical protein
MFQLGKTIVSEEILEKNFVCNLTACLGACCVDGDAGAPLSAEETKILEDIYQKMAAVEPILQENKNRFVIFPIKHHDIWEWYKKMEASFGQQKKSICTKIYPIGITN